MPSVDPVGLLSALDAELAAGTARAAELWRRRADLSAPEDAELHGLWEYTRRLKLIRGVLGIAAPIGDHASGTETLIRAGMLEYGSSTEDNLMAANTLRVCTRPSGNRHEVQLESDGLPLGELLLLLCDVVGTPEFFESALQNVGGLSGVTPEAWERAYRALMLIAGALLQAPRYGVELDRAGRSDDGEEAV